MELTCVCGECRTCKRREYSRRWRERHPEEAKANTARWRANHRDQVNEVKRAWEAKRRTEIREEIGDPGPPPPPVPARGTNKPTCECGECSKCRGRESTRRWRESNQTAKREANRRWKKSEKGKEALRRQSRAAYLRDPEKQKARAKAEAQTERGRARDALRKAVHSRKVQKLPCQVCEDPRSQGHHEDYSKPLEVIWLCAKHHRQWEREGPLPLMIR